MDLDAITTIPSDQVVTYARTVVDNRPQKKGSQSCENNCWGKLDKIPFWAHYAHSRHHYIKSNVKFHNQYLWCQVHVYRFRKSLPSNATELPRIHWDSHWISSTRIHWCQQVGLQNQESYSYVKIRHRICGLPQTGVLANTLLKKTTRETWLLQSWPHTRTFHTHDSLNMGYTSSRWFWSEIHW